MKAKKPIKLLKTSLTKLDLTFEEILLELSAIYAIAKDNNVDKLLEKYEKLSKKAEKLKKQAQSLIIEDYNQTKIYDEEKADFVDAKDIKFTSVNDIDVGRSVGKLPVNAKLKMSNICDCDIVVNEPNKFTIKAGSILCRSSKNTVQRISSTDIINKRLKIMTDNALAISYIPNGFKHYKLVLKEDIGVEGFKALVEIIYGRPMLKHDTMNDIKVDGKGLETYLKTGQD